MYTWYLDKQRYILFLRRVSDLWGLDATDYVLKVTGPRGAVRF